MRTYEVINPSDPYTFLCPDREVAALTIALLSSKFGGDCLDVAGDSEDVPIFLFGGFYEWWEATFKSDVKLRLEERAEDVVAALRSMLYGGKDARPEFEALIADLPEGAARIEAQKHWNDEHRSSMNDISAAAFSTADSMEKQFLKMPAGTD